jgi:hypothetical protein
MSERLYFAACEGSSLRTLPAFPSFYFCCDGDAVVSAAFSVLPVDNRVR